MMTPEEKRLQDEQRNRASSDFGTGSMLMRPEDTSIQAASNDFMSFLNNTSGDPSSGLIPGLPQMDKPITEVSEPVPGAIEDVQVEDPRAAKLKSLLSKYTSSSAQRAPATPAAPAYQDDILAQLKAARAANDASLTQARDEDKMTALRNTIMKSGSEIGQGIANQSGNTNIKLNPNQFKADEVEFAQDKERFTVLQVVRSEDSQKNWAQFRADLNGTFTKDFALAMYNRSIANAAIVKQNCVTIHKTLMHNVKDATTRWSDQISSLMAGAWLMLNDGLITEEQSLKFFQSVTGIQELHEKSEQNIPQKALSALMATIPMSQTRSLGDLISNSLEAFNGFEDSKEDNKTLIRYGLKVKNGDLYVSSNHPQIEKIMRDAGFTGHYNLLARLDGAKKVESCRFGMHVSCAVVLKVNKRGSDES